MYEKLTTNTSITNDVGLLIGSLFYDKVDNIMEIIKSYLNLGDEDDTIIKIRKNISKILVQSDETIKFKFSKIPNKKNEKTYSYNISVIEKRILRGTKTFTTLKDHTIIDGDYLFTIDTAHSDPNEIDCGWSETPNEHKCYNISKLNNGQFCAQPNNRTRWYQPSRTNDITKIPYFHYSTKVWKCEDYGKWRPSDTNWDYTINK